MTVTEPLAGPARIQRGERVAAHRPRPAWSGFIGFELCRSETASMLQAADVVAGVIRACAEDCLFAGWSRVGDLRDTFEKLIIEGSFGDVPQFMLSQPVFEHVIHPSLARAVTARAGPTPDPGVDGY